MLSWVGALLMCQVLPSHLTTGTLVESHYLSKQLQRALRHDDVVIVMEGVRRRLIGIPDPDPLLLINYPDLDNQFKVSNKHRERINLNIFPIKMENRTKILTFYQESESKR